MTRRVREKGKGVDKSERSGMATNGMHNTTLSKSLVVHRVEWVWPVHHKEDGKSDVLDEAVEHHNGVGEVCGCHETMPTTQLHKKNVGLSRFGLVPGRVECGLKEGGFFIDEWCGSVMYISFLLHMITSHI